MQQNLKLLWLLVMVSIIKFSKLQSLAHFKPHQSVYIQWYDNIYTLYSVL